MDGVEGDDEGDGAAKRRRDSADSQEAELGVAVDYQVVKAGVVSKKAAEAVAVDAEREQAKAKKKVKKQEQGCPEQQTTCDDSDEYGSVHDLCVRLI